jgi:hypothetical protein
MRIFSRRTATLQLWALAATLSLVALSGLSCASTSEPGTDIDPPSPGGGSGTLRVVVDVQGRAVNGTPTDTEFLATVTDTLGAPVSATVVVSGSFGDLQLTEGSPGSYSALRSGYETGSYTLNVTSGNDEVTGVTVIAPDLHTITTPTAGQLVQANTALNVRWSRNEPAAECRLETRDYDSDWIFGDSGTLWTPTIGNPPRTDQRVRIERRNNQIPQGALPGSQFSVGILCTVEPIIAQ